MKKKAKRAIDLATLTESQLLEEFADRVLAYEASATKMWEFRNGLGMSEDECDYTLGGRDGKRWDALKIEHDEDFCRMRECVRFIKKDDSLLQC